MLMSSFDLDTDARQRPWWKQFDELRSRERFFHWELEFPEVFLDTARSGFDAVLGNPPWDKVLPSKHEFYGQFDALIRAYKGNDLKRRIGELNAEHAGLAQRFEAYSARATTFARVLRAGGDFPLAEARSQAAHEDVAKYFVDRAIALVANTGALGLVVPSVFYSGDGWVGVRRYLLQETTIEQFYGFENRKKIFPIHSSYKFVNLVARKDGANAGQFDAAFVRHDLEELKEAAPMPWRVRITRQEIETFSPDTLAFLEYRSARDQEIVRKMYAGRPTLGGSSPGNWGATLFTDLAHELIYNSSRDKDLYTNPRTGKVWTPEDVLGTAPQAVDELIERMRERGFWPIFEGKHIQQFIVGIRPIRWWLSLEQAMTKYNRTLPTNPTLAFRYIARNTDARTCISALLPACAAASEKLTGVRLAHVDEEAAMTVLNSLCFDYGLRLRLSGTSISFTYILPMPVPPVELVNRLPRIRSRPGWRLGIGDWANDRSHWPLLWEANLAVSKAYGLTTDDFEHILGTFPVFTRKHPEFMGFLRQKLAEESG